MKNVELKVDDDLVDKLMDLTDEEGTDLSKWIRLWLYQKQPRPVWEVISEVSDYAKSQGLTPRILDQLLTEKE